MVSTSRDQAEGLRKLMSSSVRGLCTVLSADGRADKPALMQRLARSMAQRGHHVLLIDAVRRMPVTTASDSNAGIERCAAVGMPSLLDVALGRAHLDAACSDSGEGWRGAELGDLLDAIDGGSGGRSDDCSDYGSDCSSADRSDDGDIDRSDACSARVAALLLQLAADGTRLLVDAELDAEGSLPLPWLADGDLVVQLSGSAAAIRDAYDILRALKALCGRGTISLLVTDADAARARKAHANLFHAASRYLALPVRSIIAPPATRRPAPTGSLHV